VCVKSLIALVAVSALSISGIVPTYADETGFINLHQLRRYGNYLCTATHEHTGNGTVQKNRKLAIRSAVRSWSDFTVWEYGSDWGKWKYARDKGVMCNGNRGSITCSVVARPCKLLRR